ncbi:hypothetical protein D3C86_2021730 [compost metagenome]
MTAAWGKALFEQRVDELCRCAKVGHALGVGVIEKYAAGTAVATGKERRAVVEQHGRSGGQAGDKPVPHHPTAGAEVEQTVARMHIGMQLVLLEMLQQ